MRPRYARGVTTLVALAILAGCGGGEPSERAKLFCRGLELGEPITPIMRGMTTAFGIQFDGTLDAAANAGVWAADGCPEELANNEELRTFLIANGYTDPVADFDG